MKLTEHNEYIYNDYAIPLTLIYEKNNKFNTSI